MTEKKSDTMFITGFLMMIVPVMFLVIGLLIGGMPYLPGLLAGGVLFFGGFFIMGHAHEHAKSLPPCGNVFKNIREV